MSATFDTLKVARRLRDAGLSEPQADAVAEALRESRDGVDLSHLATKADLDGLRASTKADLEALKAATKADLAETKADILKWMFGALAAQSALIVTLIKLFPAR